VDAIDLLLLEIESKSVVQVSSNDSVRLVDLASSIFSHVGELKNLEIGALSTPENEVYFDGYLVPKPLRNHSFRNPLVEIPGIVTEFWLPKE